MMKTIAKLACILGVLTGGGVAAAASNAMTISANSFNDWLTGPGTSVCVNRQNNGISNMCSFDSMFSYGIPKGPSTVGGYSVNFTGKHFASGLNTTLTVFSTASDGTTLSFKTNNVTASAGWSSTISFTSAQAPSSGRLTAIVSLPASSLGGLWGMSLAY